MVEPGRAPALHEQLGHTATLLSQVRSGASLTDALARVPDRLRPGCQSLAFHVMRWKGSAEAVRRSLAPKAPPAQVDPLLVCALALLWPPGGLPYADHTVVDEAVKATRRMQPRSAGFVNAVLRNFLRGRERWVDEVQAQAVAQLNHPEWWIERLQHDWPDQAEAIMAAAQVHPPMTLRAQQMQGGLARLMPALDEAGLSGVPATVPGDAGPLALPQGWTLRKPVPVHDIPGFAAGHWSVQDAAAQCAAPLLLRGSLTAVGASSSSARPLTPARPSQPLRLLDACSAPGGKTAHLVDLLETQARDAAPSPGPDPSAPWAELLALDADAARLKRVADNLRRLQAAGPARVHTRLKAADARRVADWWDGQPLDGILLDAPCSASGIVRRHPDARWLRRASDIAALAQIQAELLDALWPLLRSGGRLVYATCSVFKAEGADQIAAFLQRHGLPESVIDPASPGHLLPLTDNRFQSVEDAPPTCDGFFYALLNKP